MRASISTDKAKAILARDPFQVMVDAAEALPGRLRGQLVKLLERMLGHVAQQRESTLLRDLLPAARTCAAMKAAGPRLGRIGAAC